LVVAAVWTRFLALSSFVTVLPFSPIAYVAAPFFRYSLTVWHTFVELSLIEVTIVSDESTHPMGFVVTPVSMINVSLHGYGLAKAVSVSLGVEFPLVSTSIWVLVDLILKFNGVYGPTRFGCRLETR
jgi:hypothetical protein